MAPLQEEMSTLGFRRILPPSPDVSRMDTLRALWTDAGLIDVGTREITVARTFADFEDFWASAEIAIRMSQSGAPLPTEILAQVKERLRARLVADKSGQVTYTSRANAVTGRVPS
jgi:hypothetical protein